MEQRQSLISRSPGIRTKEETLYIPIQCIPFAIYFFYSQNKTEGMVNAKHMPDCDIEFSVTCVLYLPSLDSVVCAICGVLVKYILGMEMKKLLQY